MIRTITALSLGAALLMPAIAQARPSDVNAQEFYARAKALEAKGMTAMFDKRTKPTMAQMKDAGEYARTANAAATKRGAPLYCVPANAKGLNAEQVLVMLGKVPEAQRRSSTLSAAWLSTLKRTYPCG